ncbi:MAG: putative Ig domain-containing protein, partial [Ilumatobacteraceae bacterium]
MPNGIHQKGYQMIAVGGGGGGGTATSSYPGNGGYAGSTQSGSNITSPTLNIDIGGGGWNGCTGLTSDSGATAGEPTYVTLSSGTRYGAGGGAKAKSWNEENITGTYGYTGQRSAYHPYGSGGNGSDKGACNSTRGENGFVRLEVTMSAPSAPTIGTISEGASQSITVPFTTVNAFPVVTRYDASCTSDTGGTTRTGFASSSPITVANASPGEEYTCTVSAQNGSTGPSSVASNEILVAGAPWNDGGADLPSFTGTAAYKSASPEVLTGSAGTWNTPDGYAISEYTYLWQSQTNCSGAWADAPGATKNTADYTIVSADVGNCLRLRVTATNFFGTSSAAESASSAEVTDVPVFTAQSPSTLGEQGYAYTYTFAASGGRITYSTTAAIAGLSLNTSTGVLSGTPTTSGDFTYTVTATNDSGSATTTTKEISISDGTASSIEITQQPVAAASGAALTTQPSVRVLDEDARIIISPRTIAATVSPSSGALAGTLGGTTSLATTDGVATYTNLTLAGIVETDYTLTFAITGGPNAISSAIQVTPGDLATVLFTTQPVAPADAGGLMTTQPVVRLEDAQGNVINDRSSTVVVSSVLASSTSTTSGSVGGTTSLSTSTGIATFTNLTFGGVVGTNYKIKAVSGSVSTFSDNVTNSQAGAPTKLRVFTEPTLTTTQLVGDAFNTQPVVRV